MDFGYSWNRLVFYSATTAPFDIGNGAGFECLTERQTETNDDPNEIFFHLPSIQVSSFEALELWLICLAIDCSIAESMMVGSEQIDRLR